MCQYCKPAQADNIVSVNAPGFWIKLRYEFGKLLLAYDTGNNGMRQTVPAHYCFNCGRNLGKEG